MWHAFKMCLFAHSETRGFLTGYVLKKYLGSFIFLNCPLSVCIYTNIYFSLISTTSAEEIAGKKIAVQVIITDM